MVRTIALFLALVLTDVPAALGCARPCASRPASPHATHAADIRGGPAPVEPPLAVDAGVCDPLVTIPFVVETTFRPGTRLAAHGVVFATSAATAEVFAPEPPFASEGPPGRAVVPSTHLRI